MGRWLIAWVRGGDKRWGITIDNIRLGKNKLRVHKSGLYYDRVRSEQVR